MAFDDHDDFFLEEYDDKKSPKRDSSDYWNEYEEETPHEDNSDYWEEYDEQTPAPRGRKLKKIFSWCIVCFIAIVGLVVYFRYFTPYVSEAKISGYITSLEKRGLIFTTFEAELITSDTSSQSDATPQTFAFSIDDEELARKIGEYHDSGKEITIVYKKYYGSLPWRGATPNIAVKLLP